MRILIVLFISFLFYSCSVEPTPLVYGKDGCYACKMTLMDKKFGAEVVTTKGKVYKFDDMNCMINFLNSSEVEDRDIAYRLVIDYGTPDKFIDAREAFYIKSDKIRSPMASEVAAFETKSDMQAANKEWRGIVLSWGELITQYK